MFCQKGRWRKSLCSDDDLDDIAVFDEVEEDVVDLFVGWRRLTVGPIDLIDPDTSFAEFEKLRASPESIADPDLRAYFSDWSKPLELKNPLQQLPRLHPFFATLEAGELSAFWI